MVPGQGRGGKEKRGKEREQKTNSPQDQVQSVTETHPCLLADPDKSPGGPIPWGPGSKTGKGYKQAIHGEAMQMADNPMRGYLDSTGVREMKIKATMSYYCLPITWTSTNKGVYCCGDEGMGTLTNYSWK